MKKIILVMLGILTFVNIAFAEETNTYDDPTLAQKIKENEKAIQDSENMINLLDQMDKALKENSEYMYNLCLLFYYNNRVPSEQAIPICKCEAESIDNTLPLEDVIYIQENITRWDFLMYKKDKKAISVDEKYKKIRGNCIDNYLKTMGITEQTKE